MFISSSVITMVLALGAAGLRVESRTPGSAILDICPSAHLVNSEALNVGDHVVTHNKFQCLDANLHDASVLLTDGGSLNVTDSQKRDVAECRTAVPECQCGTESSFACENVTPEAPFGNDCPILFASFEGISEQDGATFFLDSGTVDELSYGSCAVVFVNNATTTLEYCWDELRTNAGIAYQCVLSGESTGGVVQPRSGLWFIEVFEGAA